MIETERGEIARARREAVELATRALSRKLDTALKLGEQLVDTTIRQRAVMEQALAHLHRGRTREAIELLQRTLTEEKNGRLLPVAGFDSDGAAQDVERSEGGRYRRSGVHAGFGGENDQEVGRGGAP